MSAWRREALILLPEYREMIEGASSPMALWVDLRPEFDRTMAHLESGAKIGEALPSLRGLVHFTRSGPIAERYIHSSCVCVL